MDCQYAHGMHCAARHYKNSPMLVKRRLHVAGTVVAWVVRDGDELRARRGAWMSGPAQTIPELIYLVSERFAGGAPPQVIER